MIGEAHPRLGGERFVRASGRFVEDVRVPGMLHAAVLRSPHAHARLGLDRHQARTPSSGVQPVFTAADVPATAIIPNRVPAPKGPTVSAAGHRPRRRPLRGRAGGARRRRRPYIARDALERIDVVYEPLAGVPSPADALGRATAALRRHRFEQRRDDHHARGRLRQALAGAALVLRERFSYPRQTRRALETRGPRARCRPTLAAASFT
jgi:carbon-monoxide dehydrogenase large subunit